ncbi:MFS transporter [Nocardia neocaledoniensis]|uniref:MFS transporter n=1 Tax=Nocardia neocaledoniensis TaxID=236511 RepID=UPI0024561437|nr:MFS transporter [Nocardia neocaledoniensis]
MTASSDTSATIPPDGRQLRRVVFSGLLGTAIEYYDFLIYAALTALVFNKVFFPNSNPGLATIAAFGTFAAGYVARPVGGIIFGHFGDRLGRKSMLVVSMSIMGVASFLIGVLPTYATAGIAAPILLVVLRFLQGLAIGGEWGGATLMITEYSEPERRGFWNGLMQMGSPIGGLLSTITLTILTATLSDEALLSWGWRIPFLLSLLLLAAGLYVRLGVAESPLFQQAMRAEVTGRTELERIPLMQILRKPRNLLLACAVGLGPFALTALLSTYMLSYATAIGYKRADVVQGLLYLAITSLVMIPVASAITDRLGRRTVIMAAAIGIIVFAWPLYALVGMLSVPALILAMVVGQTLQSAMYAPLGALLSEMFGTSVRYTGASMGYQLAALVGAGFTPLLAAALHANSVSSTPLVAMAIGCGVITAGAICLIGETRGKDLSSSDAPAAPAIGMANPDPVR